MKKLFLIISVLILFTGCFSVVQVAKCKSYENNKCVIEKIDRKIKCKNPEKFNNKIYCDF